MWPPLEVVINTVFGFPLNSAYGIAVMVDVHRKLILLTTLLTKQFGHQDHRRFVKIN